MTSPTLPQVIQQIEQAALPAPRLQLRWATEDDRAYQWKCHYELVLPLQKGDIRREVYDDNGEEIGEVSELVVAINPPTRRGGGGIPCEAQDGTRYYDPPFRDGVHAQWDAAVLGGLPIYVIAPDGTPYLREDQQP